MKVSNKLSPLLMRFQRLKMLKKQKLPKLKKTRSDWKKIGQSYCLWELMKLCNQIVGSFKTKLSEKIRKDDSAGSPSPKDNLKARVVNRNIEKKGNVSKNIVSTASPKNHVKSPTKS